MWTNNSVYQGSLANYSYPRDKEVGDLLDFLKQINPNKRVHLTDVPKWNLPVPPTDYDIYILCMFGEAVDEKYVNKLDQLPEFKDKQIVLLTSQYYQTPDYNRVKVFHIEHLHTVIPFLPRPKYTRLINRKFTHASLSHRNAVHKTILTAKLLKQFGQNLQYTFCNSQSNEYDSCDTVVKIMQSIGLEVDEELPMVIQHLHNNPVKIHGHLWSVDNHIYHDSKLIWTAESIFVSNENAPTAYITEKTLKAIISGSCFISVGQQHTLARLRSLGFETYEKEFGIDYDNKFDFERYVAIFKLIDQFDLSVDSSIIQDIADYNHNYFYGDFYNRVERDNIDRIQQVIEYVNAI